MAAIAVRTAAVSVAVVWILVSIGGAENPGFKQYEQYLSALAATGTHDPSWGRAALIVSGVAIWVLVPVMARWRPFLGATSLLAGGAAIAMALWPMHCPTGARFCTATTTGVPSLDMAHTAAVLVFATAVISTLIAGLRQITAGTGRTPALWPALPIAVATVALTAPSLLAVTGLLQRLLLLVAQVLLVLLAAVAAAELQRRHRLAAKYRATRSDSSSRLQRA